MLSACGTTDPNLSGCAGCPTETPVGDVASTDAPAQIEDPTATPIPAATGHIIFVSDRDGQNRIYIMNADGTTQTALTSGEEETPQLSRDGNRLAFVSTVDNNKDVYVYDFNSNSLFRVTDDPANDRAPALSPDGSRVAFESFRDGNWEVYVANIDGSGLANITNDQSGDSSPAWSPDGTTIAYTSNRFGNTDVFVISANGGSPSTLTTNPSPDSAPVWSPDGTRLAYLSYPNSEMANICIITRDGLNNECVVQGLGRNHAPVWLNNDQFAFLWERGDNHFGIDTFTISSSTLTTIQSQFTPRGEPVWSPDGVRLVYQAEVEGNMDIVQYVLPTNETIRLTTISAYDGQPVWTSQ
jgi:Tol biopolymer transport system component